MAKRKPDPLRMTGDEWRAILIGLKNSGDRAAAIAGAATLDALLVEILRLFLVADAETADLFTSGPLDSFGARITMSYYLGLISKDERDDLRTIQGIRNDFAHHWGERSFSEAPTAGKCSGLLYATRKRDELEQAEWPHTPRDRFIVTVGGLVKLLVMRASAGVLSQRRTVPKERDAPLLWATPPPPAGGPAKL